MSQEMWIPILPQTASVRPDGEMIWFNGRFWAPVTQSLPVNEPKSITEYKTLRLQMGSIGSDRTLASHIRAGWRIASQHQERMWGKTVFNLVRDGIRR